jgi:hypothetical protein
MPTKWQFSRADCEVVLSYRSASGNGPSRHLMRRSDASGFGVGSEVPPHGGDTPLLGDAFHEEISRPASERPTQALLHKFNWQLCRDDGDDFQCHRIDDQNVVANKDVIEAAILRYDTHDVFGEYRNVNISRNSRADTDVEVFATAEARRVFFADNRLDSRALVLRQLHRSLA